MNTKRLYNFLIALSLITMPSVCRAQLIEEEPSYADNTGALSSTTNSADITQSHEGEALGTKEGKITLRRTDAGVDVFSGSNQVESIATSSDGWVGSITDEGTELRFQPTGRPQLLCPQQASSGSLSNWYGPCEIPEEESAL